MANQTPTKLEPLPKQWQFMQSQDGDRWVGYIGGVGSGKTWAGALWAFQQTHESPAAIGFIGANTYRQLAQTTLPPFIGLLGLAGWVENQHYVFGKRPPWYHSHFTDHKGVLSLCNGSQIVTRSLDNYDDIRGAEFGWAWIDETRDTKREAFDVLLGRMRHPKSNRLEGRITTTPSGYDWLYEAFVDPGRPGFRLVEASSWDNPHLPAGFIEALETSYDASYAEQELGGKFIAVGIGRVYKPFTRAEHVSAKAKYDPNTAITLACDFNVNPMSWVVVQERDDQTHAVAELSIKNTTTIEAAKEFLRRFTAHQGGVTVTGDASGAARSTASNRSNYQLLMGVLRERFPTARLNVPRSNPPVTDRVNAVNARLKNATGTIGLLVNPKCKALIRDLEQVAWRDGTRAIDKTKDSRLTHMSDALGYHIAATHSAFGLARVW